MGDEAFRPSREHGGDLVFQSEEIAEHVQCGNSRRGFLGRVDKGGAGFDFRFSFWSSARCAFRDGDGPRTSGFSIGNYTAARPRANQFAARRCIGGIRSFG